MKPGLHEVLEKYIPPEAVDTIAGWIISHGVRVRLAQGRSSKQGDYSPPGNGKGHRISVNSDLNKYAFLITLVHEIAHLRIWQKHRGSKLPHGNEWKQEFKTLLYPFMDRFVFPEDVLSVLFSYLENPLAASCSDTRLQRVLRKYNTEAVTCVDELPEGTVFRLPGGRIFRKIKKLRKRYRCIEVKTGIVFSVDPLAEAMPVPEGPA